MTRHAPAEDDYHARFAAWLRSGEQADPPRDLAVHAAHCVRCRAAMLALDDLLLVDLGQASIPPSRSVAPDRPEVIGRPRALAAASATIVVAAIAWIGLGALASGPVRNFLSQPSSDQGVLGGFGAGASAAAPSSAAPSMTPSLGGLVSEPEPTSSSAAAAPSASDAAVPTLRASTAAPPAPSSEPPGPSATPTRTARPSRAPVPTATPTAEPTPTPTPTPTPDVSILGDCASGVDDDDRGCALDGNEASA